MHHQKIIEVRLQVFWFLSWIHVAKSEIVESQKIAMKLNKQYFLILNTKKTIRINWTMDKDYKNAVHRKMKSKTVKSMVKYVKEYLVSFWRIKKSRSFISKQVYNSLYKYCYGIGYTEMN